MLHDHSTPTTVRQFFFLLHYRWLIFQHHLPRWSSTVEPSAESCVHIRMKPGLDCSRTSTCICMNASLNQMPSMECVVFFSNESFEIVLKFSTEKKKKLFDLLEWQFIFDSMNEGWHLHGLLTSQRRRPLYCAKNGAKFFVSCLRCIRRSFVEKIRRKKSDESKLKHWKCAVAIWETLHILLRPLNKSWIVSNKLGEYFWYIIYRRSCMWVCSMAARCR